MFLQSVKQGFASQMLIFMMTLEELLEFDGFLEKVIQQR